MQNIDGATIGVMAMGGGFTMGGTIEPQKTGAGFAGMIELMAKQSDADLAKKVLDERIAILSAAFDKSVAYNNLITLGGYAGAFTIWSRTQAQLPPKAAVLVALLLAISLLSFVSFEIYKMVVNTRVMIQQRAIIVADHTPEIFLKKINELAQKNKLSALKWIMPIWVADMIIAVSTALLAIGLLFYNFLATLLDFSQWPL